MAPPTLFFFPPGESCCLKKEMVQAASGRGMQAAGAWRQSRDTAGLVPSAWLEEPQSAHKWRQGCVGELTGGRGWTCGLRVSNLGFAP